MPYEVDAFMLLDARLDRQAIYAAGKAAAKLCEEKQTCLGILADLTIGDSSTIFKIIQACKNEQELRKVAGELMLQTLRTNAANSETLNHPEALFTAGLSDGFDLAKMKLKLVENLDEGLKRLDQVNQDADLSSWNGIVLRMRGQCGNGRQ